MQIRRSSELAWAMFVPRSILGFMVVFAGASRFKLGFDGYARAVGAIPYAGHLIPLWAISALALAVPCVEILLGTMLLLGLLTRPALVAVGGLTVLVMAGYGVTTLLYGHFGFTAQSGTFLTEYAYMRSWPLLFLLLMPREFDRYTLDALLELKVLSVSHETARAWAIFVARALVGLVFFIGGINKLFFLGAVEHARQAFIPYTATWIGHPPLGSQWSLWTIGTLIPFLEFVFPALLILGLWTRPAIFVLGGILSLVTFGHLVLQPLVVGTDMASHIMPRVIWLLVPLVLPREADVYSVDHWLKRVRRSQSLEQAATESA